MPLSRNRTMAEIRRMASEALDRQRARATSHRVTYSYTRPTVTAGEWSYTPAFWDDPVPELSEAEKRTKEKSELTKLIKTGVNDNINIYAGDDKLAFTGRRINDTKLLFTVTGGILRANEQRTKHIRGILENLALQEGWTVEITDEEVCGLEGVNQVGYWQRSGEYDDSDLVRVELPKPDMRRVERVDRFSYEDLGSMPF